MKEVMNNLVKEHIAPACPKVTQLLIEKGEGAYLITTDGERYLDFASGIAVNALGHCHPRVVKAAKEQTEKLIHGGFNVVNYPTALRLAEELSKVTPGELNMFFFSNGGAEAVEGGLKLARYVTRKPAIIAFRGAFHGRTLGALSVSSSNSHYREHYAPFLPSVFYAPYPYCYRCPYHQIPQDCSLECLEEIELMFDYVIHPSDVAALIIEPELGEGGYIPAPRRYMQGLRKLCDEHNILLISDEIQSGFGRTGKMFAIEHSDVVPDIMIVGKAFGGGFPLSAVASSKPLMQKWPAGAHGGTLGGNPVACAAALANLEIFKIENILANCVNMGAYLKERLVEMKDKYEIIGDVRGLGLMIAVEIVGKNKKPNTDIAKKILTYCFNNKLILLSCGAYKQCVRFTSPLNVSKDEIDQALDILEKALQEVR